MTVNYTPLLGLAQPVTGTESGTWGDTINASLTALLETAIAGTKTADVTSGNWTLTDIDGADDTARAAVLIPTGANGATTRSILAPNQSKIYVIINQATGSVVIKGVTGPTTGVTIASGKTTMVAWNGSDFVEITPTTASNLAGGGAGQIPYQSASGTTAMLAAGTSGQVLTSAGAAPPTWSTPAAATKTISNKTGAYTVVSGDLGSIINCTSGTFTVSLTAAASLGSGFTCTIWNTSNTYTDAITIDPNGAETIDGVATLVLRRGEGLAIVCDGTNWQIDDKRPMRGYAENLNALASRPIASGNYAMALGVSPTSAQLASADYSFAIGNNSSGQGSQAVTGAGAMALGGSYASGTDSFAAAIGNNTSSYGATGSGSSIAMGFQAKTSSVAVYTGIAIGSVALQSSIYGGIAIGYHTTSSGSQATAMGYYASATADYATAIGGANATASQLGKVAFGSASGSTAQAGKIVLTASTTTTTAVVLTSDTGAASTTNQLILASGQAMAIQGTLIAKVSGTGAMAGWNITGIVSNNGGTMAVSGLALTAIGSDSITLGAQPTIAVDNTNKGVTITSGYKSATNIRWVATLNTSEVTYA